MTEDNQTNQTNQELGNQEVEDSAPIHNIYRNLDRINDEEKYNNLFRRINSSIHKIVDLNNQLEEVFNSREDLEEEIAKINMDLEILKSIELIASNNDITLPVYEYFCALASNAKTSVEIVRAEGYLADCNDLG